METRVGVGRNLKTIHLTAFRGNQDSTFGTLGTIEHNSLRTFKEGNLFNLRRKHVVGRTLHTVDNHERKIAVIIIVETLVVHTPKIVAIPSADEGIHIFKATHHVIFLLEFFHINIGNSSQQMVGIRIAESNMDLLFHHCGISIVSSLGIDRQWRRGHHGKE